jgi:hypothetical protein
MTATPTLLPTFTIEPPRPSNRPPDVASPGNQSGRVGQAFSLQVQASDPDNNGLSFSAAGLPSGLSIDPLTGIISGTPTAACACQVTVVVEDGLTSSSTDFVINIPGGPPEITSPGDQTGVVGQEVSLQIQALDPDGDPISFGAGGLPDGLSIDLATGLISGTPTSRCECAVTVTASAGAEASSVSFVWNILDSPYPSLDH